MKSRRGIRSVRKVVQLFMPSRSKTELYFAHMYGPDVWDWMGVVRKPGTIGDPGTKAELREMGLAWLWCAFAMAEISRGIEIARIPNAKSAQSAKSAND